MLIDASRPLVSRAARHAGLRASLLALTIAAALATPRSVVAYDAAEAAAALAAHRHGPDDPHALPVEVVSVERGDRRLRTVVRWTGPFDPVDAEHVTHVLANLLPVEVDHLEVLARQPDGRDLRLDDLIAAVTPARPEPAPAAQLQAAGWAEDALPGALDGRVVILSPGHGWYTSPGYWTTQRGWTFGLKEDFITQWIISQWLVPMLERAGATVWVARERDFQTNEIRLDDSGEGGAQYAETGAWQAGTSDGGWAGTYRAAPTAPLGAPTATASWTHAVPASGWYGLYGRWVAGSNRVQDAHFVVRYAGGVRHLRVDQTINSRRWVWLGQYYFESHQPVVIELHNDSAATGYVVADAFRVGGGVGDQPNGGVAASGHPRWEESASVWVPFAGDGAKSSLAGQNDVVIRPKYADWQGGDVFISLHSNAAASPNQGTGTDTFIHDTAPSAGSAALRALAHDEVIAAIKTYWDPAWKDRGKKTANFGEVRELKTMPGFLIETAFHDTETPDNKALGDADFRALVARGLYKGVLRYLEGEDAEAIPLPPDHVWVRNDGQGRLRVGWQPVDDLLDASAAPAGFRIWTSPNGRGFSVHTTVHDGDATDVLLEGLPADDVVYVQVTAFNGGGESLPSEVLAARVAPKGTLVRVLLVNGFDRLDKAIQPTKNTRDFVRQHAAALAEVGEHFDGASNEAAAAGLIPATDYALVDWLLGEESTADETFDAKEQALLDTLAAEGVSVIASGAEIAWDLDKMGGPGEPAWLAERFGASLVADAATTTQVVGKADTMGGGLAFGFAVADGAAYEIAYPDVLGPKGAGQVILEYLGGGAAGILRPHDSGGFVLLGFPFEVVAGAEARAQLMSTLVHGLIGPAPEPQPVDPDPEPDPGPEPGPEPTPEPGPEPMPETTEPDAGPTPDGSATEEILQGAETLDARVVGHTSFSASSLREVDEGCAGGGTSPWGGLLAGLVALTFALARRRHTGDAG